MALNVSQLLILAAIRESGSISGAARRLGVSQPGVSKQLRALERFVGHPLIVRGGRGARFTETGAVLAEYATRIVAITEAAERAVADASSLKTGRLAVGATPTIANHLLPEVIVRFQARFPGISLHVETQSAAVLCERVIDGALDLGLTQAAVDGPDVRTAVIGREEMIVIAPAAHVLAKRKRVMPRDLEEVPFVLRVGIDGQPSWASRTLARSGVTVRPRLTVGSTAAVKHAVGAGVGLALISRLAVRDDLASGRLVQVRVRGLALSRPVYHVTSARRLQTRAAAAFLPLIGRALRGTPSRKRR